MKKKKYWAGFNLKGEIGIAYSNILLLTIYKSKKEAKSWHADVRPVEIRKIVGKK